MGISRRQFCRAGIAAAAAAAGLGSIAYVAAQPAEQVIRITAKKFEFLPHEVTLKKGVPVVLEFVTADVVMGFNAPDLGVRADIVPGKVAQARIVPQKLGTFEYLCDIFCGSGHEEMSGKITVIA
jgi:cytochrome c oxidase subunit 2